MAMIRPSLISATAVPSVSKADVAENIYQSRCVKRKSTAVTGAWHITGATFMSGAEGEERRTPVDRTLSAMTRGHKRL